MEKGLTNTKRYAKIVNCIIIARTVGTLTKSDKLVSSNLHKSVLDGATAAVLEKIPERYQYFEWSD